MENPTNIQRYKHSASPCRNQSSAVPPKRVLKTKTISKHALQMLPTGNPLTGARLCGASNAEELAHLALLTVPHVALAEWFGSICAASTRRRAEPALAETWRNDLQRIMLTGFTGKSNRLSSGACPPWLVGDVLLVAA